MSHTTMIDQTGFTPIHRTGRVAIAFRTESGWAGRVAAYDDMGIVRALRKLSPTAIHLWAAEDRPHAFREDHRELPVPVAGVLARTAS